MWQGSVSRKASSWKHISGVLATIHHVNSGTQVATANEIGAWAVLNSVRRDTNLLRLASA